MCGRTGLRTRTRPSYALIQILALKLVNRLPRRDRRSRIALGMRGASHVVIARMLTAIARTIPRGPLLTKRSLISEGEAALEKWKGAFFSKLCQVFTKRLFVSHRQFCNCFPGLKPIFVIRFM